MVQFFAIKDGGLVLSEFKPAAHNDGSVWLLSSRTEERETAASLMETRDSLRRVPQTVVSLLELINQAIHIHRALHKQSVKVTCDALKFDKIVSVASTPS